MSPIRVGDKVRWDNSQCEVVLGVTSTHAFVVYVPGCHVYRAPLSELTLVESAPMTATTGAMLDEAEKSRSYVEEALAQRESLLAENARLREALQMAVDTIAHNGPDGVSMAAALGIRPSIRHKETP